VLVMSQESAKFQRYDQVRQGAIDSDLSRRRSQATVLPLAA
jgi:hypothetical protein